MGALAKPTKSGSCPGVNLGQDPLLIALGSAKHATRLLHGREEREGFRGDKLPGGVARTTLLLERFDV